MGVALLVMGLSVGMPWLTSRGLWISIPCWFNKLTGIPCLTCGLTRSFSLAAHGKFSAAFEMHLLGPLIFFLFCAGTAYLAASLFSGFHIKVQIEARTKKIAAWSILGVFLVCWIINIAFMRGGW